MKVRGREGGKVKSCLLQTLPPDKDHIPDTGPEGYMSQSKIITKLVFQHTDSLLSFHPADLPFLTFDIFRKFDKTVFSVR